MSIVQATTPSHAHAVDLLWQECFLGDSDKTRAHKRGCSSSDALFYVYVVDLLMQECTYWYICMKRYSAEYPVLATQDDQVIDVPRT